jgi:hypothetical protein
MAKITIEQIDSLGIPRLTEKFTLTATDYVLIVDSADSYSFKKLDSANLPGASGVTFAFTDITEISEGADYLPFYDNSDTNLGKKTTIADFISDNGILTSFTETNDLTAVVVWANIPDANVPETAVTQHEAALTITESQISDLSHFTPSTLLVDYSFTDNSTDWDTAFGWGDHSVEGYLTSILEEEIEGTGTEDATLTGAESIDLSTHADAYYTLTGNTTISVTNTPAVDLSFVRTWTIKSTAAETLTLPGTWVVIGTYANDTSENYLTIRFSNYTTAGAKVVCYITQA